MNKNRATKSLSILLAMCMLLGMLPMTALADNFSDIKGHWAESQINEMINEGIVKGYPDGSFKPDGDISRAEFVSLIVKAFKLTKAKGKDFDDISNHWAKDAILTANAHGIVNGYSDTKFGPDDPITREQMAVIIVKVAHLTDNSKGKTFVDSQDISEWAKKAVAIASSNQLITGYPDNTFKPSGNASRAEATAVLSKSLTIVNLPVEIDYSSIENSGKYGPETGNEIIESDVIIKAKDVILQNLIIKGDLIISKEVGDGDATLNNVKVEGKTYIRGGGIDSIHINQGEYREIIIERTITGAVRILTANVQRISITISENDNGEDVILNGEIKTVTIKADGIKVISQGETTIDKIEVTRGLKDVKIELTEDTEVKEIILDSKVDVKGKGEIEKASGSKIRESTFVTAPKRIITPSTGGNGSSSSGGSGSGGTSTTPTIKVSAITVTGAEGATTITTDKGTLQMKATVTPEEASNKAVTWSVDDTSKATINASGLLTAVANGTVKVTATAKDGSGKSDSITIMISGQTVVPVDKNIKSVGTIADINVANGTELASVGLPTTVEVTLDDDSTQNLTVSWDGGNPAYAKDTAGTYEFSGTLTLPANVTNTSNLTATVKVIVAEAVPVDKNIKSVGTIADINVANGTELASVGLPTTVEVTLDDDTTQSLTVTWDGGNPVYAKDTAGTYEFSGTLTLPANVTNTSNLTATVKVIVAEAVVDKYVVTFSVVNGNGSIKAEVNGTEITSGTKVEQGSNLVFTATPDAGYKVKEWKQNDGTLPGTDSTLPVTGLAFAINMTVEFEATTDKYTVTYDSNTGSGDVPTDGNEYAANEEVTVAEKGSSLERTHYLFDGWNTKADGSGTAYAENDTFNITANTTLYAQWTPVVSSILINKSPTKTEYADGENLDLDGLVVKVNYADNTSALIEFADFEGNYLSTSFPNGQELSKTEHQTLNVHWDKGDVIANIQAYKVYYRVTFDAQGGTGVPTDALTKGTSGVQLTELPRPTKTGYAFNGWFTEKTGGEEVKVDYQFTKNTTIYAQWLNSIPTIEITGVTPPVGGVKFDTNYVLPTEAKYSIHGSVGWIDVETNQSVTTGEAVAGKKYKFSIILKPDDGYGFLDIADMTATVNSNSAEIEYGGDFKYRKVICEFTAADPEITDFTFTTTTDLQEGAENVEAGKVAGTLSDPVGGTADFTYSLVAGEGDTDNAKFQIDGTDLKIKDNPLTEGTYKVRIQIEDSKGKTFVKAIEIAVAAKTNKTPVADDYTIGNLTQTAGSVTAVTITAKEGKSSGAVTIYYEGSGSTSYTKSETVPSDAGTYTVTFDVAATTGWNTATGLAAGTLTINAANQNPVADDFDVTNLTQLEGSVTAVTITAKEGKSSGAVTIYYEGTGGTTYTKSETLPTTAGTYAVTFDVAAATGWNSATGLDAGTLVISAAYTLTLEVLSGWEGGTITATVDGSQVNTGEKVADGKTVIITVEPDMYKMFSTLKKKVGETTSDETNKVKSNKYSFTIEADTTIEASFASKKISIGGTTTTLDGKFSVDNLTWEDETDTVTMNGYTGTYLAPVSGSINALNIKVVGENTLTAGNKEALSFTGGITIEGATDKDTDKLTITVTGSSPNRAIYLGNNGITIIKNATLDIDTTLSNGSNLIYGIYGGAKVDGGHLELKVNKSNGSQRSVYGIRGVLTLENEGTANIEVIGADGTTRVTTHDDTPWISAASKVVAEYKTGDGADADNPFAMTVTVPSTVTAIKSDTGTLDEGVSSILVGDSGVVTLYAAADTTNPVDEIDLTEDEIIFYAVYDGVWFKITVIKAD